MTAAQRWLFLVISTAAVMLLGVERFSVWYRPGFELPAWITVGALRLGFLGSVCAVIVLPIIWHLRETGSFVMEASCQFLLFVNLLLGMWSCYLFEVPYRVFDFIAACGRAFFYR